MKIGDVYYEKHTIVGISKRTGTVSETDTEIVEAIPPIEVLGKIRAEIESMDFDFGDYYDHTDEIIEMVCKVIDKYKAEIEKTEK